ncbi:MAG: hypothetical protein V3R85_03640 [Alphaproteobacteria bacterium]
MKMMTIRAALMAATGAVLVSMAASAAGAVEITVFRGSEVTVVDTNAPHKGPHVLRGGMTKTVRQKATVDVDEEEAETEEWAVVGAGGKLWLRGDDGLAACWLRGTGYVGGMRIHCVGAE